MSRKTISEGKSFLFDNPLAYSDNHCGYVSHHIIELWNEFADDHRIVAHLNIHDGANTADLEFVFSEDDLLSVYENNINALRRIRAAIEEVEARFQSYHREHKG